LLCYIDDNVRQEYYALIITAVTRNQGIIRSESKNLSGTRSAYLAYNGYGCFEAIASKFLKSLLARIDNE